MFLFGFGMTFCVSVFMVDAGSTSVATHLLVVGGVSLAFGIAIGYFGEPAWNVIVDVLASVRWWS